MAVGVDCVKVVVTGPQPAGVVGTTRTAWLGAPAWEMTPAGSSPPMAALNCRYWASAAA